MLIRPLTVVAAVVSRCDCTLTSRNVLFAASDDRESGQNVACLFQPHVNINRHVGHDDPTANFLSVKPSSDALVRVS